MKQNNKPEPRPPQTDDLENAHKAFEILFDCMRSNSQIEPTLWASALWSCLARGFINCNIPYEIFKSESYKAIEHLETWWED